MHPSARGLTETSVRLLLILSLIFLQEGFTYYLSFQVLATFLLAKIVHSSKAQLRVRLLDISGFLAFAVSLAITALYSPFVISTNSSNIFVTAVGVMIYASLIFCLPLFRVAHPERLLVTLRSVSSTVILLLIGILCLSESTLVPFLNREAMTQQNARLIDNFTDADALSVDQAFRLLSGEVERIDLFYGEPSFLAIVLFACLGSYMLASTLLMRLNGASNGAVLLPGRKRLSELAPYAGVFGLLYIQSFSSIIYALIAVYFLFIERWLTGRKRVTSLVGLVVLGAAFALFSYDYLLYRLTMSDSLSFAQRFGFLFELGAGDLLTGVRDVAMLPEVGIHNGLFYVVAVAGVGGLAYLLVLLRTVYDLAAPIKLAMFSILIVLAILMQNGGVFSPNKVVLFGLVLLPLACSRALRYPCRSLQPVESS